MRAIEGNDGARSVMVCFGSATTWQLLHHVSARRRPDAALPTSCAAAGAAHPASTAATSAAPAMRRGPRMPLCRLAIFALSVAAIS
jgi:hypothetical protein